MRTQRESDTLHHMDAQFTPRPPRPHRIVINVDAETLQALKALAYAGDTSVSSVSAECLRMLLPTLRPVMESIAHLRTAPADALEKLSTHAEAVAVLAEQAVSEIRDARGLGPPSCNTGVNPPRKVRK